MGFFNFFGDNEHRVFNYKPMYYDKDKEEQMRKFRAVDGSLESKEGEKDGGYVPGSYIQGAFRDGAYQHTRNRMKGVQTIIGIVTMLLIVAVLFFIAKFYSML